MAVATPSIQSPPLKAYSVLAVGIVSVALAAIFIRLALDEGVPALVIAAARLCLAALMLTPITLQRHRHDLARLQRRDWGLLIVSGIFLAIHFSAWVSSLQYASVLVSGVLVTTSPIWVGLLEVFVLRAKLSRAVIIGLMIAFVGSIILGIPTSGSNTALDADNALLGGVLALIGALTVAVYMIIGRKYRATLPLLPYIWVVYGTAAIIMLGVLTLNGLSFTGYTSNAYVWMALLAIFPQLIGHSSLNYALAYLPATYVSIATQIEPILSAIVAIFLFSEIPGWAQILGSIVIMVGVALATLNPWRGKP